MKKLIPLILLVIVGYYLYHQIPSLGITQQPISRTADHILVFPSSEFPETGKHIKEAIQSGESAVCTIDRADADNHRKESLKGIPTKKGYDRDEWPMAMCKEGGNGANIMYISPKDNRGAGSWVSNKLSGYPNGTKIEFKIE